MMECHRECSDEQLLLYHYDELAPPERQDLDMHLVACPACRAALEELRSSLAAVPRASLRLTAAQRLRFVEQVEVRTRRGSPRNLPVWGGALVAAGIFGISIMLIRPGDHTTPVQVDSPARTDFELVEQLDLLQDLALLQDFELLQELENL